MDSKVQGVVPGGPSGWLPVIAGLFLGLLSLGLPMIGVTVNLYLGAIILALGFALVAWGLWIWEGKSPRRKWLRVATICATAVIYFSLVGVQIYAQYKKDHPIPAVATSPTPNPSRPIVPPGSNQNPTSPTRPRKLPRTPTSAPPPIGGGNTQGGAGNCQANAIGGNATVENCNSGPPPLKLTWKSEAKPSQDVNHKFYQEIRITPNVEWHPVSIVVKCSDEIKVISPYGVLIGADAFVTDQSNKWGYVFVKDPPISAGYAFIVGVFADKPITVESVEIAPNSARKNMIESPSSITQINVAGNVDLGGKGGVAGGGGGGGGVLVGGAGLGGDGGSGEGCFGGGGGGSGAAGVGAGNGGNGGVVLQLNVDQSPIYFGESQIGSVSEKRKIVVRSSNDFNLPHVYFRIWEITHNGQIQHPEINGEVYRPDSFEVSAGTCVTGIAPHGNCALEVTFSPKQIGKQVTSLAVCNSLVELHGVGVN